MEAQEAFQLIARHEGAGGHIYGEHKYLFPNQITTLWDADAQYDPSGGDKVVWGRQASVMPNIWPLFRNMKAIAKGHI